MFTQLSLISWNQSAADRERAALKSRVSHILPAAGSLLVDDLPQNRNGGDMLCRINFRSRTDFDAHWAMHDSLPLPDDPAAGSVQEVVFESRGSADECPGRPGRLYRALVLALETDTPAALVDQFEREMIAMPAYVPSILRWNFGRVVECNGARAFTHVWEQEFVSLADFRGDYMDQPYHWGHLDRWFDSDNPARIVDPFLCNTFCPIDRPILFKTA